MGVVVVAVQAASAVVHARLTTLPAPLLSRLFSRPSFTPRRLTASAPRIAHDNVPGLRERECASGSRLVRVRCVSHVALTPLCTLLSIRRTRLCDSRVLLNYPQA